MDLTNEEYRSLTKLFLNNVDKVELNGGNSEWYFISLITETLEIAESDLPFDIFTGASKVVLVPRTASKYVIKIPFYANEREREFYGADSLILQHLEKFQAIVPSPITTNSSDYCATEVLNYQLIEKYGAGCFFAKTFYFDTICGINVYLQERVLGSHVLPKNKESSRRWSNRPSKHSYKDSSYFAAFLEFYSEEQICALEKLLEEYPIGDLNSWNFGSANNLPIIYDYAGYYDNDTYSNYHYGYSYEHYEPYNSYDKSKSVPVLTFTKNCDII